MSRVELCSIATVSTDRAPGGVASICGPSDTCVKRICRRISSVIASAMDSPCTPSAAAAAAILDTPTSERSRSGSAITTGEFSGTDARCCRPPGRTRCRLGYQERTGVKYRITRPHGDVYHLAGTVVGVVDDLRERTATAAVASRTSCYRTYRPVAAGKPSSSGHDAVDLIAGGVEVRRQRDVRSCSRKYERQPEDDILT